MDIHIWEDLFIVPRKSIKRLELNNLEVCLSTYFQESGELHILTVFSFL
jgi:hypothetical protein